MCVSVQKKLLALGRAYRIAEGKDQAERVSVVPGGHMVRDYTVVDGLCTCPEFNRNQWMAQAEAQGKRVAPYPGAICKHVLAVQILSGELNADEAIGKLSGEALELVRSGYKHQRVIAATRLH